ncbi:unnamed protein product [Lepidochelys kempii]
MHTTPGQHCSQLAVTVVKRRKIMFSAGLHPSLLCAGRGRDVQLALKGMAKLPCFSQTFMEAGPGSVHPYTASPTCYSEAGAGRILTFFGQAAAPCILTLLPQRGRRKMERCVGRCTIVRQGCHYAAPENALQAAGSLGWSLRKSSV